MAGEDIKGAIDGALHSLKEKYLLLWGINIGLISGMLGNLLANHVLEISRDVIASELWFLFNASAIVIYTVLTVAIALWIAMTMKSIRECDRIVREFVKTNSDED